MEYTITTKKNNEGEFWKLWDAFARSEKTGPRYTRLAIENFLEMSQTKELLHSDESFVLGDVSGPVACAFLPVEKKDGVSTISFYGTYTMAPLFKNPEAAKKIFALVEEAAHEAGVSKIMFQADPLLDSYRRHNFLEQYRYFNTSVLTYLLDLQNHEDFLKDMRKGHRCDVKKVINDPRFRMFCVDRDNADYNVHEEYRELHHKAAGRVTRSKVSFDSQFEKMKAGNAVLFGVAFEGRAVAYAYFEMADGVALYGSGADEPGFNDFPLYHSLIYTAMEYFKKKGARFIDVMQPANPSMQFDYYPDEKQLNIAFFKRGFPGIFVDQYRGIKYLNRRAFESDVDLFKEKFTV